jgi:hypothetical protein
MVVETEEGLVITRSFSLVSCTFVAIARFLPRKAIELLRIIIWWATIRGIHRFGHLYQESPGSAGGKRRTETGRKNQSLKGLFSVLYFRTETLSERTGSLFCGLTAATIYRLFITNLTVVAKRLTEDL